VHSFIQLKTTSTDTSTPKEHMASNFPKLPGYVPTHDPTIVSHKKVSHVKLEKNRNGNNVEVPLYAVPRPPVAEFRPEKTDASKSLSQTQYVNHIGGNINEQFEPTFVKLDKQVRALTRPRALIFLILIII